MLVGFAGGHNGASEGSRLFLDSESLVGTTTKPHCGFWSEQTGCVCYIFQSKIKGAEEACIMIEIAAAIEVVKLVSSSVGLIDKVYDSWSKFVDTKKVDSKVHAHFEKIEGANQNTELVHTVGGRPKETITIDQLRTRLNPGDLNYIDALYTRMEINERTWNGIVKEIELETNIANKTKYEIQLEQLKKKIGKDLDDILKFIEYLGFDLDDHYGSARAIAGRLQ
jgi:hypothetical protein